MIAPTLLDWTQWISTYAILGLAVPGLAWLASRLSTNAFAQLRIWRSAFVILLLGALGEFAGTFEATMDWLNRPAAAEREWRVSYGNAPDTRAPGLSIAADSSMAMDWDQEVGATPWLVRRTWLPGFIFLTGVVCGAVYFFLLRLWLWRFVLKKGTPCDPGLVEACTRAARRLGLNRSCRLLQTATNAGPFVFGALRPVVALPADFNSAYSSSERELVFAHELAHVRNRDALWQPWIDLATILFWWHPLIWRARFHTRLAGEFAADARVVNAEYDRESLAESLVQCGRRLWTRTRPNRLLATGAAFESQLGKRVKRLLNKSIAMADLGAFRKACIPSTMFVMSVVVYFSLTRLVFPDLAQASSIGEALFQQNNSPASSEDDSEPVEVSPDVVEEDVQRYTRTFKVDGNTFKRGMLAAIGYESDPETVSNSDIQLLFRKFIRMLGVDLPEPGETKQSESTAFFNPQSGMIFVRAPMEELDIIEQGLSVVNQAPPQVTIEVKLVEIPQSALDRLPAETRDFLFPNETESDGPASAVLTSVQYASTLAAIKDKTAGNILTGPRVTTLSGRQTEIQVIDRKSVVFPKNAQGLLDGLPAEAWPESEEDDSLNYTVKKVDIGSIIRILPHVAIDPPQIELTVSFLLREFLGYDDPSLANANVKSPEKLSEIALPRLRERKAETSATILDGQTLMLGPISAEKSKKLKSKVPVLGDFPKIGHLFSAVKTETETAHLIVFMTATIIDPAGNRIYPDPSEHGNFIWIY